MSNTTRSARIARARGVGRIDYLKRDRSGVAVVDFDLDLDTATGEQLTAQRTALLARLGSPASSDDVSALTARAGEVTQAMTAYNERVSAADAARRALLGGSIAHSSATEPDAVDPGDGGEQRQERHLTFGRAVTESAEFRAYNGQGRSGTIVVPGAARAVFASSDFPSQNTRVPGIQTPNRDQPLTVLDLIDRQSITTNVVEWVQEDTPPGAAAEVAEGALKPESTFELSLETSVAATIAHWVNITRQALADEAQIQGYIQGRLTFGLLKRLAGQVLVGNGTAPNLRGILNTSGIGTYVSPAGEDPLIAIRKARTVAELSEYTPDGVVLNPTDWEAVELSTDDQGAFRAIASVGEGLSPRVWGLTVIVATVITAGTALVGAFREGATLWEREGVEVYITDSHASNFTSNILTMLAEMRAALSVWRPKAFVKVTFTPAAP